MNTKKNKKSPTKRSTTQSSKNTKKKGQAQVANDQALETNDSENQ